MPEPSRALSADELASTIAAILAEAGPDRLKARGFSQSAGRLQEAHVEFDRRAQTWFIADVNSELEIVHRAGVTKSESEEFPARFDRPSAPLHLLFPPQLRMWGRDGDEYIPRCGQALQRGFMVITFEHVDDPALTATVTYDPELRLVVRLVRPTDTHELLVQSVESPLRLEHPRESLIGEIQQRYVRETPA